MSDREVLVAVLLKQTEDLLRRTRRQIEAISADNDSQRDPIPPPPRDRELRDRDVEVPQRF